MLRELDRDDVEEITDWDASEFARWLGDGIQSYAAGEADSRAFSPLGRFIDRQGHLALDLAFIFRALPTPQSQRNFREGLAIAFAERDEEWLPPEVIDFYLAIGQSVGAWQIFQVLVDKMRTAKDESYFLTERGLRLTIKTMLSVRLNSGDGQLSDNIANAFYEVVRCKSFPNSESGNILISLLGISPKKAFDHLQVLRESLCNVFDFADDVSEEIRRQEYRNRLVQRIQTCGPLATLEVLRVVALSPDFRWLSSTFWLFYSPSDFPPTALVVYNNSRHINKNQKLLILADLQRADLSAAEITTRKFNTLGFGFGG